MPAHIHKHRYPSGARHIVYTRVRNDPMEQLSTPRLPIDREALADFCRRHHITRLAFFGSVLRDDFRPDSDIDVLVEFQEGHTPGWEFFDIQDELAALLGRPVDLGTFAGVRPHARDTILSTAQTQYER